jgi:subtilisin family serine protease
MDTGIDYLHPDLAPNYDFALSRSFVDIDFDGIIDEDEMDYNGHGSHCGGIVAAAINNDPNDAKCVGVGPTLDLVNLKVMTYEGWGYFSWDIVAIYYAVENGIDVISMSFGGYVPMFDQGGSALFSALQRVFNYASRNGIVAVASAGNSYMDMDGLYSWRHLPSQCSNVICVIGTNIYNDLAYDPGSWGSNYGSCLHGISAPGGDWADVEPEWYEPIIPPAYWWGVYGYVFSTWARTTTGWSYAWAGGTSMAAPHVAGVAGLILSVRPGCTPSQVEYFLRSGAEDIGELGYDEYFNFGLVNAYNSVMYAQARKGVGPSKYLTVP